MTKVSKMADFDFFSREQLMYYCSGQNKTSRIPASFATSHTVVFS